MKTELELGLFKGFYGSAYEAELDSLIDEELSSLEIDYDEAQINYDFKYLAKSIFEFAESEYYRELPFIKNMSFSELFSPKYYNYSNDKIYFNCDIDKEIFKGWLVRLISDNDSDLLECIYSDIIETHTSCSGFSSFHSNKVEDWISELLTFDLDNEKTAYKLGFILSSFIENKARLEDDNYCFDYSYLDYDKEFLYCAFDINKIEL